MINEPEEETEHMIFYMRVIIIVSLRLECWHHYIVIYMTGDQLYKFHLIENHFSWQISHSSAAHPYDVHNNIMYICMILLHG